MTVALEPAWHFESYSRWDDSRLGALSQGEFCDLLHQRALDVADDIYDLSAYRRVELGAQERVRNEIAYLQRRAWAEWFFGTVTPARQIALLPAGDVTMKLRLARQIKDEVRHHDVFVQGIKRRKGEWRVQRYQVPQNLGEMLTAQIEKISAYELAAANQYSGEVVLSVQDRHEGNILREIASSDIMRDIEDIETDEPAHIAIGRDLVKMYATSVERMRAMAKAQETFLNALAKQHVVELEALGVRRGREIPQFEPAG
jgi:hypothetical protein